MNLREFQIAALRTLNTDLPPLTTWEMQLDLCALGLAGESGEVVDLIKKALYHRHNLDRVKLKLELADTLWYLSNIATLNGFDMSDLLDLVIEKLKIRYPDKFTSQASIDRIDVK